MGTYNAIMDIHHWIVDIYNSIIHNLIINIHNSIVDI